MKKNRKDQGFTLIELLVVIAIIAILAVVVVLTLNPAELLRQARDSNRVSDFATLKSALSLYATDVSTSTPMYNASYTLYAAALSTGSATLTDATYETTSTGAAWGFQGSETLNLTTTTSRSVGGTGWIPVNMNAISSGAPISVLPVDPLDSGSNFYIYAASSTVFKLAAKMESVKYSYGGAGDVVSTDGGNSTSTYEQGTNITSL